MHPFVTQACARRHQASLMREAEHERITSLLYKRPKRSPRPLVVLQQQPQLEPDFAAIRQDLRSTLSEWCLETRTESFEEMIDTFMRRLKLRLGHRKQRQETGAFL